MNKQWTHFPNLLVWNNSRRVDLLLTSINLWKKLHKTCIYEWAMNADFLTWRHEITPHGLTCHCNQLSDQLIPPPFNNGGNWWINAVFRGINAKWNVTSSTIWTRVTDSIFILVILGKSLTFVISRYSSNFWERERERGERERERERDRERNQLALLVGGGSICQSCSISRRVRLITISLEVENNYKSHQEKKLLLLKKEQII